MLMFLRLLPYLVIGIGIMLAPATWFIARQIFSEVPVAAGGGGGAGYDAEARIELERLRAQVEQLRADIATVNQRAEQAIGMAQQRPAQPLAPDPNARTDDGPNLIVDAYAQVVLIANRRNVNEGLTVPSRTFLIETLGRPRETLTDECQGMTNERLNQMLFLGDVGPIRVRMLQPAVESLRRVFEKVRTTDQDLYDRINTSGSLCVRRIRGTAATLSSHAFGLALDINIDGQLDTLGDGRTQLGLTIIADFFKEEQWIWGAGFGREDSMHFEVSQELLSSWRASGQI
ncbi:MAG: M15 family metallopeptidase [Pseudomonadota bacterium]